MSTLVWGDPVNRQYQYGLDRGVLYLRDNLGNYTDAYPWDGLLSVKDETPGRDISALYQDGIRYANIVTAGDYAGTLSAYTYPDIFESLQGVDEFHDGIFAYNQLQNDVFGLSYRTRIGNANDPKAGYRIHVLYNLTAMPDEMSANSTGSNLEATELSWKLSGVPVVFPGIRPTCHYSIDSRRVSPETLRVLEDSLYGSYDQVPSLFTMDSLKTMIQYDTITDIITEPL